MTIYCASITDMQKDINTFNGRKKQEEYTRVQDIFTIRKHENFLKYQIICRKKNKSINYTKIFCLFLRDAFVK